MTAWTSRHVRFHDLEIQFSPFNNGTRFSILVIGENVQATLNSWLFNERFGRLDDSAFRILVNVTIFHLSRSSYTFYSSKAALSRFDPRNISVFLLLTRQIQIEIWDQYTKNSIIDVRNLFFSSVLCNAIYVYPGLALLPKAPRPPNVL